MKAAAIATLALSGLFFVSSTITLRYGKRAPDDPNQFLPYAVGLYLIPVVALIIGVAFWNKASAAEKKAKEIVDAEVVDEPPGNPFV